MARARRGSTAARRTNWIGEIKADASVGPVAVNNFMTIEPLATVWAEIEGYVDPTLVRIRGSVDLMSNLTGTAGAKTVKAYAILWHGPDSNDLDWSVEDVAFSSDRILWVGSFTSRSHVTVLTSVGMGVVPDLGCSLEVDSHAMRKLGDDERLWLTVWNTTSSSDTMNFGWALRALIKE